MTPVFAVGDVSTATRLLAGREILVSAAYLGSSWIPWDKAPALLAAARGRTCDSGAFTIWQRRLKKKCEACGERAALPGTICHVCTKAGRVVLSVETWAQFIVAHAEEFDRFIALDEIGDAEATMRNWIRLLSLVPADLHGKLVPVWHEGDPADQLHAYDPASRLVALGRTKGRQAGAVGVKATRVFYDAAFNAYPSGSYWLLGNCNPDTIEDYPAEWFDATSWQRDSAYGVSHGWPWSHVSKDTRMRAYLEAIESITYRPREPPKQTGFAWAEHDGMAS